MLLDCMAVIGSTNKQAILCTNGLTELGLLPSKKWPEKKPDIRRSSTLELFTILEDVRQIFVITTNSGDLY